MPLRGHIDCRCEVMDDSWSRIRKVLLWANVVLEEIQTAMSNSYSTDPVAQENVDEACQAIGRLVSENNRDICRASADVDYEELVMKLQAQVMPIEPEEWDDDSLD